MPLLVLLLLHASPRRARGYSTGVDSCTDTPGHGSVAGPGGGFALSLRSAATGAAVAAYSPGASYTLSIGGSAGSSFRGLQAGCFFGASFNPYGYPQPNSVSDPMAGTLAAGSGTRTQSACAGVTQSDASFVQTRTAAWTAPAAGSGPVVCWAVIVVSRDAGHYTASLSVPELAAATATASTSPSPSKTPSASPTPSLTASVSAPLSATPSQTPTPSSTSSPTSTPTASLSRGATASSTSSWSTTPSTTPSPSSTPSLPPASASATPSMSAGASATPSRSASASAASASPSATPGTVAVAGALVLSGIDAVSVAAAATRAVLEAAIAAAVAATAGLPAAGGVSAHITTVADTAVGSGGGVIFRALQALGGDSGGSARVEYTLALLPTLKASAAAVLGAVAAGGSAAFAAAVAANVRSGAAAAGLPAASFALVSASAVAPAGVPASLPFSVALSPALTMSWRADAAANRLFVRLVSTSPGWASIAFTEGAKMVPGDAVLVEPAAPSAVSQAALTSYAMSGVARVPPAAGTLDALATRFAASDGGGWSAEFSRPLSIPSAGAYAGARSLPPGSVGLCAAWGAGGLLAQHAASDARAFTVDLSTGSSAADASRSALIATHGSLMTLSWAVLVPLGIGLARFGRGSAATVLGVDALTAHMRVNVLAWLLTICGAGCGLALVPAAKHFVVAHAQVGLAVLVLALPQPLLGLFVGGDVHRAVGVAAAALSFASIFLGLGLAGAAQGWSVGLAALLAAWCAAFVALECRQKVGAAATRLFGAKGSNAAAAAAATSSVSAEVEVVVLQKRAGASGAAESAAPAPKRGEARGAARVGTSPAPAALSPLQAEVVQAERARAVLH